MASPRSVAVIGAGIAGLSCARALHQAGVAVRVFDKGRGVAGRSSTRRSGERSDLGWDHGAVSFLAEQASFRRETQAWLQAGVIAPWTAATDSSWVGVPSMSAVARHLAEGLSVHTGTRIERIEHQVKTGWHLFDQDRNAHDSFSQLVMTAPPAQSRALLEPIRSELTEALLQTWMQANWALLAISERVDRPAAIRRAGSGQLPEAVNTLVCEDTKPGRAQHPLGTRWTMHMDPGWSHARLEQTADQITDSLSEKLAEAIGVPVLEATAHRWRYARVHRALGVDCLQDPELPLLLAGDFCRGDGIESAWLSGRAAAKQILQS